MSVSVPPAMRKRPLSVETYNAHDRGAPTFAHFVHVTERPSEFVLRGALSNHRWFYPDRGSDAMGYDSIRLERHGDKIEQAWKSGREHGKPGTTPRGFVLSWWGRDRISGELVAFVGGHLVNNAFGPPIRGERALRRRLWWQGWKAMRREAKRLQALGYTVFKLGDLNRRPRWWPNILTRSIGPGYDRIVYPTAVVELVGAHRGPANGSDHKPLIGEFTWKG